MCVPIFDENDQTVRALGINRDITDRITEIERLESSSSLTPWREH